MVRRYRRRRVQGRWRWEQRIDGVWTLFDKDEDWQPPERPDVPPLMKASAVDIGWPEPDVLGLRDILARGAYERFTSSLQRAGHRGAILCDPEVFHLKPEDVRPEALALRTLNALVVGRWGNPPAGRLLQDPAQLKLLAIRRGMGESLGSICSEFNAFIEPETIFEVWSVMPFSEKVHIVQASGVAELWDTPLPYPIPVGFVAGEDLAGALEDLIVAGAVTHCAGFYGTLGSITQVDPIWERVAEFFEEVDE